MEAGQNPGQLRILQVAQAVLPAPHTRSPNSIWLSTGYSSRVRAKEHHLGMVSNPRSFIVTVEEQMQTATKLLTELGAEAVTEISAALRPLLADTFALYLKTKNFHWHISGPHF